MKKLKQTPFVLKLKKVTCLALILCSVISSSINGQCAGNAGDVVISGDISMSVLLTQLPLNFLLGNQTDCAVAGSYPTITSAGFSLIINGNLTIDVSVIFRDLDLIFPGGKGITVNNNYTLIVQAPTSTTMRTCSNSQMWNGITLAGASSKLYMMNGAPSNPPHSIKIWDAKYGVHAYANAEYYLDNVEFNRNQEGVYVDITSGSNNGSNYLITNCLFTCEKGGAPTNILGYTVRTQNGVDIKGGLFYRVGYDYSMSGNYPACSISTQDNIFQYVENGVRIFNSDLTYVVHNTFLNLTPYSGNMAPHTGIGVTTEGTNSLMRFYVGDMISGSGIIQSNTFSDCRYGIRVKVNAELRAAHNTFNNPNFTLSTGQFTGIDFYQSASVSGFSNSVINNNTFNDFCRGITMSSVNSSNSIQIHNNVMLGKLDAASGAPLSQYGILSNTVNSYVLSITDNPNIDNAQFGIRVSNIVNNSLLIFNNHINYTLAAPVAGSLAQFNSGIYLTGCSGMSTSENWIVQNPSLSYTSINAGIMRGIELENCLGTIGTLICNHVNGMGMGFYILGNNLGNTFQTNFMTNTFYGFSLVLGQMDPMGFAGLPASSYYNTFNSVTDKHVQGTVSGPPIDWYFFSGLDDPNPFSSNTVFPHPASQHLDCFSSPANSSNGNTVETLVEIANDEPAYNYFAAETKYQADDFVYTTLKDDTTLLDSNVVLKQFYDAQQQSNIDKYKDVKDDIENNQLQSAAAKLAAITDANQIEINKKIVLQIYLNKVALGIELDAADIAALNAIAYTPGIVFGAGVYWARAILQIEVDDKLLLMSQYRMSFDEEQNSKTAYSKPLIFPNPARDEITLNLENGNYFVTIYDVFNRKVFENSIENSNDKIMLSLKKIKQGIYWIHYKSPALEGTEKMIVIK